VFDATIIVSLLQLSQFAQFMIGDKCEAINPFLEKYFDTVLDGDDTCFDVVAILEPGCWILFGASLIFIFGCIWIQGLIHSAIETRTNVQRSIQ
jgi:hypothetical protein